MENNENQENREYKYDAFISYRHCELDKYVAENLHKILESYELPRNIKKKLNIKSRTIKRVFRDQEELPLTSNLEDPIISALEDSKYLIVICSPRLKDSLWCKKEIETFKKLRGRKNIFCVLVEGEPADSFPEEVTYEEVVEDGKVKRIPVEPLAADVRGITRSEVLKKIKEEKLRLVAPMYNLDYDDLKQRHKLRRQKKILTTAIIVAASCFLFAVYSLGMVIKINTQQNILAEHQALSLASKAEDYLKKDSRYEAIKSAYQALTEFEMVSMPYTPEAEYSLVESMGLYDAGASYKAVSEVKTEGVADYIKTSADNKFAAVYDESEQITLFSTKTLKVISNYRVKGSSFSETSFAFIGENMLSFINEKGNISIVNAENGSEITEIEKEKDSFILVKGDFTGEYLVYADRNKLYVYNAKENRKIGEISSQDTFLNKIYFSEDSNYIFAATEKKNYDANVEDYITMHVIDTKEAKEINNTTINAGYISGILTKGNNAYMLLNRTIGVNYNMLVVSYDFINGNINWTKTFENNWGKLITRSYPEGTNNIAVANHQTLSVLNAEDGEIVEAFNANSEILNVYPYVNTETYLLFLKDGSVNFINMENRKNIEYAGKFEFNLDEYAKVTRAESGFLLIPKNENRVILYLEKTSEDIKEEDIQIDYPSNDSVYTSEKEKIIEEYNVKNKSLVENIFYDTDKELLFVTYTNNDMAIYRVNDKTLLKTLSNVIKANHYFGKDKYNRIYIGETSNAYIIDENYNKVGHIKNLREVDNDRVIVSSNSKFYSIKIYNLNDALEEADEYLDLDFMEDI